MEVLNFAEMPVLRNTILVMAFEGWSDPGDAATQTVKHLMDRFGARRLAWVKSDHFYQFSHRRPTVEYADRGLSQFRWPTYEFFYCPSCPLNCNLMVGIGAEPDFQWGSFCEVVLEIIQKCQVETTIVLGAQMMEELHTDPVAVEGHATGGAFLGSARVLPRRYEGFGGIVDAIYHFLETGRRRAITLWANVPNYVHGIRNPRAVHALLARLACIGRIPVDLKALEASFAEFEERAEEAVASNPNIASYVSRLKERHSARGGENARGQIGPAPSGEEIAHEIEHFFKENPDKREDD